MHRMTLFSWEEAPDRRSDDPVETPLLSRHASEQNLVAGSYGSISGSLADAAPRVESADAMPRPRREDFGPMEDDSSDLDKASVDWRFLCRFYRLLKPLRPYSAGFLVILSVVEALVVSRVGKVAGSFYRIVVDAELHKLASFLGTAASYYVAVTLLKATNVWLSELLALRWRGVLTRLIQAKYLEKRAFYWLPKQVDNPDQRIAADLAAWCKTLGDIMQIFCAAPLQVIYYSFLTYSYTKLTGLAFAYGFFLTGFAVQKLIVAPLASLVFRQEKLEGDFRAAHLRLCSQRTEVAMYRAEQPEAAALERGLQAVLRNAGKIVARHWLLETATKGLEYAGALLNYCAVATVVFGAAQAKKGGGEGHGSGKDAELVSNASFAMLTLIYAFTQLLDTAEKVSNIAGYTARVSEMIEELDNTHLAHPDATPRSSIDTRDPATPKDSALAPCTIIPPGVISYGRSRSSFELSVHNSGREMRDQICKVFPGAPIQGDDREVFVVPTFQIARNGVDLGGDCATPGAVARMAEEMDRMLERFMSWTGAVVSWLEARDYWANAIDPRTGMSLFGEQGIAYSEAKGALALLGYSIINTGVCDVISHPVHGTRIYPASLFTNAPINVLQTALEEATGPGDGPAPTAPRRTAALQLQAAGGEMAEAALRGGGAVVALQGLQVERGSRGELVVSDLNLTLGGNDHLLITGPSGCGKSTLLKALAKMWPIKGGSARLPAQQRVMFLPQSPVLAPGLTLAEQILYPFSSLSQARSLACDPDHLRWLLQAVGLDYLWERADGAWQAPQDWLQSLSPGELQRISVARVLARRPSLVLLDEPTSAVGRSMQASLYAMLRAAGITIISVGHGKDLEAEHSMALRLSGDGTGTWHLEDLAQTASQ